MRRKTFLSRTLQLDRTIAYTKEILARGARVGHHAPSPAIVTRTTRHFLAGDVAFIDWSNGLNMRHPMISVTAKGHRIRDLYQQMDWDGGHVHLIEVPDHLAESQPDDPALRQVILDALRVGNAAAR